MSQFPLELKAKPVITYYVQIDEFELNDLFETVESVGSSDIEITNPRMITILKRYEVIESAGSQRWLSGATKGKNYSDFLQALSDLYDKKE